MTIPSLCSAIRSQLYFSQITAWSDLLKSSTADIPELFNNPRIKRFSNTNTPKLDILYRIRPYDNTSCFNGKPNIHNFPDTVINESSAIKVCLKSLPRQNAIPKLEPNCSSNSNSDGIGFAFCNATSVVGQCSMVATVDTSQTAMMDVRPNNLCVERGKHHCTFDDGMVSDEMDASSPLIPILSHRDRQLLKYKKRLLKREKKKRSDDAMDNCSSGSSGSSSAQSFGTNVLAENSDAPQLGDRNSINSIRPPLYSMTNAIQTTLATAKATETVKVEMKSIGTQTDWDAVTVQNQVDQTDVFKYPNCDFCGIEMQYVCWNCDNKLFAETSPRLVQTATLSSSATTTTSPPCNEKANLLLQAIQRTPSAKQSTMRRSLQFEHNKSINAEASFKMSTVKSLSPCGDGGNKSSCDSASLELSDCHLCKRQKTMHNYFSSTNSSKTNYNNNLSKLNNNNNNIKSNSLSLTNYKVDSDEDEDGDGEDDEEDYAVLRDCSLGVPVVSATYHRRTMSESIDAGASVISGDPEQVIELSRSTNDRTVLSDLELKMYRRAYSEDVLACGCEENGADCSAQTNLPRISCQISNTITTPNPDDDYSSDEPNRKHQLKTPISHRRTAVMATNYKVNPLYVMCPSEYTQSKQSPIYKKPIPKVNLTKQFSRMPSNDFNDPTSRHSSMDLLLNSSPTLYGSIRSPNAFNFDNLSPISLSSPVSAPTSATIISSSPVHKSNSAPTMPVALASPSHSLSPRFLKASAILKRRTRHLSDRSSFGSDELFSDEEFGAGLDNTFSPTMNTSKVSALGNRRFGSTYKPFAKCSFGMRPLLGKFRILLALPQLLNTLNAIYDVLLYDCLKSG